jgi:hypothetical protein
MKHRRAITGAIAAAVIAAMMLAGGCATPPRSKSASPSARSESSARSPVEIAPRPPNTASDGAADNSPIAADPCAARLHELSGALLFYYAAHRALPASLDALRSMPGFESSASDLTCPVSREPYIYNPAGLPAPAGNALLVVYDATAAHDHRRWAIALLPSAPDQPLIAKVIAVPDAHFPRPSKPPP